MKNDLENSLDYFKKAYSAAEKMHHIKPIMVLILRRGEEIAKKMGLDTAFSYYNLMLEVAKSINDLEAINEFKLKIKELPKK